MSLGRNGQDEDEDQSGTSGKHHVQHQLFHYVGRGEIDPCTLCLDRDPGHAEGHDAAKHAGDETMH